MPTLRKEDPLVARPKIPSQPVHCPDLFGHDHSFPADSVRFRPAAYGLLYEDQNILLSLSRFSEKWDLPGGGVESWEKLEDGLVREFFEETGVSVTVQSYVAMQENFISFFGHPYHSLRFYYVVQPPSASVVFTPESHELLDLRWWPVDSLPEERMNSYEVGIIKAARSNRAE